MLQLLNFSSRKNRQKKQQPKLKPALRQSRNIHSLSFINPACKTQQRQELVVRYLTGTGYHIQIVLVARLLKVVVL